jgi:hypothetical protein
MSEIRGAIPRNMSAVVFEVPCLGTSETDHQKNVRYFLDQMAEYSLKAKRARVNGPYHLDTVARYFESLKMYVEFFGLPETLIPSDTDITSLMAQREELQRVARERDRERQERARKDAEETIARWIAGDRNAHIPYSVETAFMRLSPDGAHVETSKGADVPADHVRRIAPVVLRAIRTGMAYIPESDTRLGHYRLDRITAKGDVYVGCHHFEASEILRFATVLESASIAVSA